MRLAGDSERLLLAGILSLFVCRAVMASAIVPPWQGPDEPIHFVLSHMVAHRDESDLELQPVVLQSMARYHWWEPYGGRTPDPVPTSFRQIQRLGVGVYDQPLYYGLGGAAIPAHLPAPLP